MTDGLNICEIVEGVARNCVPVTDNVLMMTGISGDWGMGAYIVMGPYCAGILLGAVIRMFAMTGERY